MATGPTSTEPPTGGAMAALALAERVRELIRARHYSLRTERSYVGWVRRFLAFHRYPDPDTLRPDHVRAFLAHLSIRRRVSAATQNQAFSALLFCFRVALERPFGDLDGVPRARPTLRLPVVLTPSEARALIDHLPERLQLVGSLIYGAGLRLQECLSLRVRDIDLERMTIVVRDGKGRKDRVTVLPETLVAPLRRRLGHFRAAHADNLAEGRGRVTPPRGVESTHPHADQDLAWQWIFPAARDYVDKDTGVLRRHHLHPTTAQRAFREATRAAGLTKPATSHSLRHSFATHLIESGHDIRTVQDLMGHRDLATTMIYTRFANPTPNRPESPLDTPPASRNTPHHPIGQTKPSPPQDRGPHPY